MFIVESIFDKELEAKARLIAVKAHGSQKYGPFPFEKHLKMVVKETRFWTLPHSCTLAAWLHDTIEDTELEYSDIKQVFGEIVADLVEAVTNGPGNNRKERHEKTYPKILKEGTFAIALKLCDRISNVRFSRENGDQGLLKMYKKEHPGFKKVLKREGELETMWEYLDALIEIGD